MDGQPPLEQARGGGRLPSKAYGVIQQLPN
jgi:hypothetical protein